MQEKDYFRQTERITMELLYQIKTQNMKAIDDTIDMLTRLKESKKIK